MLKVFRIIFKILLFISVMVTVEALFMHLNFFNEGFDGKAGWSTPIALLLFGDGPHSINQLFDFFYSSSIAMLGFFLINTILDIVAIVKKPKCKTTIAEKAEI